MLRILAALTLLIAVFTASGEVSYACGCADPDPMPESQLDALKARAARGDVLATGAVWYEYEHVRENPTLERQWRFRAIRAGDPGVARDRASHWMLHMQRSNDPQHKRIFIEAAVALLDRGYRNRSLIELPSAGIDHQSYYVSQLREAKAARRVLIDGIGLWEARARRGDVIAAHHVAVYYFWVDLNQERRTFWEARASALGDPDFAGVAVLSNSNTHLRDVRRALAPGAPVYSISDPWERAVTLRNLRDLLVLRRRQSEGQ